MNQSRNIKKTGGGRSLEEILSRPIDRRAVLKGALAAAPLLLVGPSLLMPRRAEAQNIGPSTTTEPFMLPTIAGVETVAILTVGDSIGGYRLVGLPDGLGAYKNGNGNFTLLVNHEIGATAGAVRAHGSKGAFVSRWTIDRETLEVLEGEDLTQSPSDVFLWDTTIGQYVAGTTAWQRLCSADLAKEGAYYFRNRGTQDRLYLNGEETSQGRAFAHVATGENAGEAWQLPRFGRIAYENAVASPYPQAKTVVVLLDDSSINTAPVAANFPSEVYVYIGEKTRVGHPIERAGLTNGSLYGLKVSAEGNPVTEESNEFGLGNLTTGFIGKGKFTLHNFGDVSNWTAADLEQASIDNGVTRFQRVEDGAWDPRERQKNDFYFVTTASLVNNCRLWRLRFDDVQRPEKGGSIEMLLKGDEGHKMLDNVTIDRHGRILMDEDPGNTSRTAKIWMYTITTKKLVQVAEHTPKFFDPAILANPDFITQDEESSGLIDAADILGDGWFLFDVQAHTAHADPELVEPGQLLALFVPPKV
ncbi:MAG: phytase [Candidatus Binatia bacterium]